MADEWVVGKVADAISVAFTAATSHIEALQPSGFRLLEVSVRLLRGLPDVAAPGCFLLSLYAAQIGAALRPATAEGAPPVVAVAAHALALAYARAALDPHAASHAELGGSLSVLSLIHSLRCLRRG